MNTLKDFIKKVDSKIESQIGLNVYDLPDFPFVDYWHADCANHKNDFDNAVACCVSDLLNELALDENPWL